MKITWIGENKIVNIERKHYASMEAALIWYATASDGDIKMNMGSLARIAIGMNGSAAALAAVEEWRKTATATKQLLLPEPKPMNILRLLPKPDPNAALGAVAEEPIPLGATAPMCVALCDLEEPMPLPRQLEAAHV